MDLAIYISELLGLRGEVNLPGIGYFAQVRSNGAYNERENKFYPPGHQVSFRPQAIEDDILAKYISEKKHISLASSIYFIDKYVINLKQQVALQDVEIAGLGYLQTKDSVLTFKANNAGRENDPAFYGFPPVNIYKLGQQPEETREPVVIETPKVTPPPVEEEVPFKETPSEVINEDIIPVEKTEPSEPELYTLEQTEYADDEPVPGNKRNIRIVIALIVAIIALSLVAVYQYYPGMFDRFKVGQNTAKPAAATPVAKPDTTSKTQDTTVKKAGQQQSPVVPQQTTQTAVDTFATVHYDILAGAYKTLTRANIEIKKYQQLGLKPSLMRHVKGKFYKINLGTYFNRDEAIKAEDSIVNATKINITKFSIEPYKPKK
jgi:hypothetical protein